MTQPLLTPSDAHKIPRLGSSVFKVPQHEATETVTLAIQSGYKAIDTAAICGNEEGVGAALAEANGHIAADRADPNPGILDRLAHRALLRRRLSPFSGGKGGRTTQ